MVKQMLERVRGAGRRTAARAGAIVGGTAAMVAVPTAAWAEDPAPYGATEVVSDVLTPISSSVPVIFAAVGGLVAMVTLVWFGIRQVRKGANRA